MARCTIWFGNSLNHLATSRFKTPACKAIITTLCLIEINLMRAEVYQFHIHRRAHPIISRLCALNEHGVHIQPGLWHILTHIYKAHGQPSGMCVHKCNCQHICICICMYVYIYIYIYIYISRGWSLHASFFGHILCRTKYSRLHENTCFE